MDYTLKPTLEYLSLVKIVTTLWSQNDIWNQISGTSFGCDWDDDEVWQWQIIENKVKENLPKLPLPKALKEKVLNLIKPIGQEIFSWMYVCELQKKLCWTPQGTIDKREAVKEIIKDEFYEITTRYRLACIYCLEDDIRELWNKIPENRRHFYYGVQDSRAVGLHNLVVFWTYFIKGEVNRVDWRIFKRPYTKCSPYQYAFECAVNGVNKVATEYFFQKLTPTEREESLVRYAKDLANAHSAIFCQIYPKEDYAEVLCFLLSQMDESQQTEVFKSCPKQVLKYLLCWPWPGFFMETVSCMWDFLPKEDFSYLLMQMVNKVKEGHKYYDYQKLFGEFWKQSLYSHKRYVVCKCLSGFLISKLFEIKDKKNIKLILKEATLTEKEKLFHSEQGRYICNRLVCNDEWDLLEFFIQECLSSKEKLIEFKEDVEKSGTRWYFKWKLEREIGRSIKFYQLLADLINGCKNKKRNMEDGESSPAKIFSRIELKEVAQWRKK